ncbi:MAG: ABC transporter permease [Xanthomonadaceae bacterium]|nr:ABC transporter permease [Xanthomonadaceae bacterium]
MFKARVPEGLDAPFVVWLAVALWPWLAFSEAISRASESMPSHKALISKVAVPRELLTLSNASSAFTLQLTGYAIVLVVIAALGARLTPVGFPNVIFVLLTLYILATGIGWFVSALRVFIPDLDHLLPTLLMFWFFMTPIIYAAELLPPVLQPLTVINPLAALVEDLRAALLAGQWMPSTASVVILLVAIAINYAGWRFYSFLKPHFEDFL